MTRDRASDPPWIRFRECGSCGHANRLAGCQCPAAACICHKKNTGDWNGVPMSQGVGWQPEEGKR